MDFFYTKIENSGPATARIGIKGHAPLSQFLNSSFILQLRLKKVYKKIAQFKKIVALGYLIQQKYRNDIRNMLP